MAWSDAARAAALEARRRHLAGKPASYINQQLKMLERKSSKANDAMLKAGRNERYQSLLRMTDPLALHVRYLYKRKNELMSEVTRRMGPGYYSIGSKVKGR